MPVTPSLRLRDLAAVSGSILMWGVSFPLLKHGLDYIPPLAIGAARHFLAAGIGFALLAVTGNLGVAFSRARRGWRVLLGVAFFLVVIPNVAQNIGMQYTTASLAALIQTSAPAFTVILAPFFLRESLTWNKGIGLTLALAASMGLVLLGRGAEEGTVTLAGNLLMVVSALSYGFAPLFSKTALKTLDPLETMGMAMVIGGAALLGGAFLAGESFAWIHAMPLRGWIVLGGLGLLPCFLAQYLWYTVLRHQEASRLIAFTYVIPFVGVGVSFLWLGERPSVIVLLLGIAVIAGVAWVQRDPRAVRPERSGEGRT
jgi:drug/metabolite transporter (DMT)-like permease